MGDERGRKTLGKLAFICCGSSQTCTSRPVWKDLCPAQSLLTVNPTNENSCPDDGQPCLHCEFKTSQSSIVRPCFKNKEEAGAGGGMTDERKGERERKKG